MLHTRQKGPPAEDLAGEARGATEVLLGVLKGLGAYEPCILEAERDGDSEVAAFLRELRRQDLLRAREATRLLRRSIVDARVGKERAVC